MIEKLNNINLKQNSRSISPINVLSPGIKNFHSSVFVQEEELKINNIKKGGQYRQTLNLVAKIDEEFDDDHSPIA